MNNSKGIVYCLSNKFMPGLYKIGMVGQNRNVKDRISELTRSTGVPIKFECEFYIQINDYKNTEKYFHKLFKDNRVNPRREFFLIDIKIIKKEFKNRLKHLEKDSKFVYVNMKRKIPFYKRLFCCFKK